MFFDFSYSVKLFNRSDCRQNPPKGLPIDGFCHFWIGIALKTLISSPDACFPGGVRRASSSWMLVRGLGCHAIPPGVKRLPLQSTSLALTQAGCQVQVAIFFKFMAANVSIACIDLFLRPRQVVHRTPCFSFASAKARSIVSLRFAYICLISSL